MKLAYVVNANLPPDDWAHTVQVMNMCKAFAQNGAEVTLFIPKRNLLTIDPFERYGMERIFKIEQVTCIDLFVRDPSPLWYWIRLTSFYFFARIKLWFRHFDRVYSRDLLAPFLFPGAVIERHSFPASLSFFHHLVFRMSDGIVVLTSFIKERFVKIGVPSEKIFVASDAVDLSIFTGIKSLPHIPEIKEGDFIMGYTGALKTMNMEKGLSDCLTALKSLPDTYKLLIVGGEPVDIDFYKKMAESLGVSSRSLFIGRVPYTEVSAYTVLCNVLLAPFPEHEHYSFFMSPLKIFEYMASHRPIISTTLPSIKEVLTDGLNAILIPPNAPSALADAVCMLTANPDRGKEIADRAYADVVEKYTWNIRAQHIINFMAVNK